MAKLPPGYIKADVHVPVIGLEHADQIVDDRIATPLEELLANEERTEVLHQCSARMQMVFILREYGFSEVEVSKGMSLELKTVRNYQSRFRKIRENIAK